MSWLISKAMMDAYANSHCSQEPAAESSVDSCSDGELYAQLNVMPTQRPFWHNDRTMDVLSRSPFGLTWKPLTESRGAELLTWYRAGFPARTYPQQEKGLESQAQEADCGKSLRGSLAKYDRATSSWKTRQCLLLGGLESFAETWPRWGMTRRGELFPLPTPALPTCASESGSWGTPRKSDAKGSGPVGSRSQKVMLDKGYLCAQVKQWPTPRAANPGSRPNGKGGKILAEEVAIAEGLRERGMKGFPTPRAEDSQSCGAHRGNPDTLTSFVKTFATPLARDFRTGQQSRWENPERTHNLNDQIGGQLNPPWVEWLMAWPIGWTDLKPLATDKFQAWLRSHGESCSLQK